MGTDLLQRMYSGMAPPMAAPGHDRSVFPTGDPGIPVFDVDSILAENEALLHRIRIDAGVVPAAFDAHYLALLRRYATYAHLVPASETHHHKHPGGLLRHGMEVALFAMQSFPVNDPTGHESPERRHQLERRWKYAAFVAGLVHDLGKPISDLSVVSASEQTRWNPFLQTLLDWAETHELNEYYVCWRTDRRHKRHEEFTLAAFNFVVPAEGLTFLGELDPGVLGAVLAVATDNVDPTDVLSRQLQVCVRKADSHSVFHDLQGKQRRYGSRAGAPGIEDLILTAIDHLAKEAWAINAPGARIWRRDGEVFIVWHQAAPEIHAFLSSQRITSIPSDPDVLADILQTRGFAVPNLSVDASDALYWLVQPVVPSFRLSPVRMLKLKQPSPVLCSLRAKEVELRVTAEQEARDDTSTSDPPSGASCAESAASSDTVTASSEPSPPVVKNEAAVQQPPADAGPRDKDAKPSAPTESIQVNDVDKAPPPAADTGDAPTDELFAVRPWGLVLQAIASDVEQGRRKLGHDYFRDDAQRIALAYPAALAGYGFDPKDVVSGFYDQDWLYVDPAAPMKKVLSIRPTGGSQAVRVVVLAEPVSRAISTCMPPPAEATGAPSPASPAKEEPPRSREAAGDTPPAARDSAAHRALGRDFMAGLRRTLDDQDPPQTFTGHAIDGVACIALHEAVAFYSAASGIPARRLHRVAIQYFRDCLLHDDTDYYIRTDFEI